MVLNVRCASWLIVLVTAACAARSTGPSAGPMTAPRASRAALEAKPTVWATRDPSSAVVPVSIRRLQVVITRGWAKGEHYAWLISDGSDVIRVFRCSSSEIGEIIDAAVRTVYPTAGTPLDKVSFGVVGSIHNPPPPPPGPGGFPGDYVEQVMRTAWNMNREQVQIDGALAGP